MKFTKTALTAGTFAASLLAGSAFAQTAATWVEIEDNVQISAFGQSADTVDHRHGRQHADRARRRFR